MDALFLRANFGEARPQRRRQRLLDLRRDESDSIQILDVDLVFQAETGELHVDQVGDGRDQETLG